MSWVAGADLLQSRLSALRGGDLEPLVPEQDPEGIEDARLVVHDQDRGLLAHAASSATILAGKKDSECGAGAGGGVHQHQAAMRLHRALHDGQAQPAAAGPAGDERLEQPLADRPPESRARCPGPGAARRAPCWCRGGSRDGAPAATVTVTRTGPRGRLHRVEHQVGHHPVQQVLVALHHGAAALDRDRRRPARQSGWARISRTTAVTTACRSSGTNWVARTRAKSRNSLSSRLSRSLSRTMSPARNRSSSSACADPGQLLHRAPDRGQRVPDLVGQRRAQRRHRLQPLGPDLELLHLLEVRDVGEDRGDRGRLLGFLPEASWC